MSIELITRYVKILIAFVLLWTGIWFFNNFGCSRVEGPEMTPTIPAEKNASIDPKVRHPDQLVRDDIIAFSYDVGNKGVQRRITARVVGLPGDKVRMAKGEVFVNNEKFTSITGDRKSGEDAAEILVPKNTVYVLCDNRSASRQIDSRSLGPIGYWAIVGKLR